MNLLAKTDFSFFLHLKRLIIKTKNHFFLITTSNVIKPYIYGTKTLAERKKYQQGY